jgi:hypothetical protein
MATTARRPVLVTALVVLVVIAGILSIITAFVAFGVSGLAVAAAFPLILGLVYLGVAKGLADGRNWARMVTGVVAAVEVLFAILAIVNSGGSTNEGPSIGSGVFGLVILGILFSPKANAFFGSQSLSAHPA